MKIRPLSIKFIVSIALVCVSIADIGILSMLLFRDSSRLLKIQLEEYYSVTTKHIADEIDYKFSLFESRVEEISQNTLLVNGLIDELGREQYLPHFIKGLNILEFKSEVYLGLFDFELNTIEANDPSFFNKNSKLIDIPVLTRQVIESGRSFKEFNTNNQGEIYFVYAVPVFYEGNPEGVLLAALKWQSAWKSLTAEHEDLGLSFIYEGREIASSGLKEAGDESIKISIHALPEALLISSIPRRKIQDPIFDMAKQMLIWGLGLLAVMLAINILLVARKITQPIIRLQSAVSKLSSGEWHTIELSGSSKEIHDLADNFNIMSAKLEETQNELRSSYRQLEEERNKQLQSAYTAGMAENAIAVLHNIGNALTPIVVNLQQMNSDQSLSMIIKYTKKLYQTLDEQFEKGNLGKYMEEDEKGKQMVPFFGQLADQLEKQVELKKDYVLKIDHQLQHITEIIALQQKYANFQHIKEIFAIDLIIGDVLEMMVPDTKKRNIFVNTEIEPDLPHIEADKNKFVQVIMNFLKNAVESIDIKLEKSPEMIPEIRISANRKDDDMIQITIGDTGIGASVETQERAFEFGYTTKERGSGFGLHDCANFIRANNGEISISSPGIDLGVTVQFTLPVKNTKKVLVS